MRIDPSKPAAPKLPKATSPFILMGLVVLTMAIGGFGSWAVLVPIEGAVIVSGQVKAERRNQTVKSLDGGILQELLVTEGEQISKGQIIAQLDDREARAQLNRYEASLINLLAEQARLRAVRSVSDVLDFSALWDQFPNDPRSQASADIQRLEFESRRLEIATEKAVLNRRIDAVYQEIAGIRNETEAVGEQIDLLQEELADVEYLNRRELALKRRILELKRALSKARAEKGDLQSRLGQAEQRIAELHEQRSRITLRHRSEAATRLSSITREMSELSEQIEAANSLVSRMTLRAPSDAIVVSVLNQTPGGVLKPGEDFIELLPLDQAQEIEAVVPATDIDSVHLGQKARLRFLIFQEKDVPQMDGVVSYISADSSVDPQNGQLEYQIRLRPAALALSKINHNVMVPGSPVEAFITTPSRTFSSYALEPLLANFDRTFRDTK